VCDGGNGYDFYVGPIAIKEYSLAQTVVIQFKNKLAVLVFFTNIMFQVSEWWWGMAQ